MQRISFATLLLVGLGLASSASADVLSVDASVGRPGSDNSVTTHYFSVSETDDITIDFDGRPAWSFDHFDAQAYLFATDGSGVAGALITEALGSSYGNDFSFTEELQAGQYMLVVGDKPLSEAEARAGVNEWDWRDVDLPLDGTYTLTIESEKADLAFTSPSSAPAEGTAHAVPELSANSGGAALLLLLGGLVLFGDRRRRFAV